ncbi:hypothetical protein EPA93_05515 [Ktedonosporobacter rubrisoli]|uniref:Uncharacterized protein n=1 Tax=Ktedonosporobacter rubrisoli TaxID=2509675 RepID=A0A4P6JK28_KTERU|nr:hypothetical protein [Ktedonosporobacter rubrisoli]QBD75489.1 hypothetical protein EPA93_05515 [Ktedonosporobacter rubrisoli]
MQHLLTSADALLSKLGPFNHLLDSLAQHIAPQASAQASTCPQCECYDYCTEIRCSHGYARLERCYQGPDRRIGCDC